MIVAGSAGCTTVSLERYTLLQVHTSGECRDSTVLNCLAAIAANPDTLPSFSLYGDGNTTVQDMISLNSNTSWTRLEFIRNGGVRYNRKSESTRPMDHFSHLEFERLEALQAAAFGSSAVPRGYAITPGSSAIIDNTSTRRPISRSRNDWPKCRAGGFTSVA